MHQFLKFILFCGNTLRVSDGLSVHHQESKTVHTASGICRTDSADSLLAGTRWNESSFSFSLASSQQNLFDICLMLYLTLAGPCIIIQFRQINQPVATVSQVYYLTFMCRSTCFGRPTPIIRSL